MNFVDRKVQHPNRIKLKEVRAELDGIVYDIERAEGTIIEAGTPLNAETLNSLVKLTGDQTISGVKNFTDQILEKGERVYSPNNPPALYRHNIHLSGADFKLNLQLYSKDPTYNQASFAKYLYDNNYQNDTSTNWPEQALACSGARYIASVNYPIFGVSITNSDNGNFWMYYEINGVMNSYTTAINSFRIKSLRIL